MSSALKGGLTAAMLVVLILLGWAFAEPRLLLDVQETEATLPDLPDTWVGEEIAVLADFQIGMWMDNYDMVERAVAEAIRRRPKVALIAGDFVYHPDSSKIRKAVRLVRPLADAETPVFAVLGNHDYALSSETDSVRTDLAGFLTDQLEAVGITVLENESVQLDGVYIVGIGSAWADRSRPQEALERVPEGAPRIVFMHNPIAYRDLPANSAPLSVAAHTHGGQLRVPFTPSESWLHIARPREVIADGWAADSMGAAGNRVYVNRGIGFSIVPLRFRCTPELTMITLRRGSTDLESASAERLSTSAPSRRAASSASPRFCSAYRSTPNSGWPASPSVRCRMTARSPICI